MELLFRIFSILAIFIVCYGNVDIGKYLKICPRNSPEVNECLVEAIEDSLSVLTNGIPELDFPPLDPYNEEAVSVHYKNNQIEGKLLLTNINVRGYKKSRVQDARLQAEDDRLHLEVDLTTPRIEVTAQYDGFGRFSSLQLNASGKLNVTMTSLKYTWKIDGMPEKINNDIYAPIKSFYMNPDIGNMKVAMTNKNPESQSITNLAINFLNQNWRTFYPEMLPQAISAWNRSGTRVANRLFLKVPYEELFPISSD